MSVLIQYTNKIPYKVILKKNQIFFVLGMLKYSWANAEQKYAEVVPWHMHEYSQQNTYYFNNDIKLLNFVTPAI